MHAKSLKSYLTLCDSMDCSLPGSSVHGVFQANILEWVIMTSSRGSSWLRDRTNISYVSRTGRQVVFFFFLTISTIKGFPYASADKESACNVGDLDSVPGFGRSLGEGNGSPLQYSGLENYMDYIVTKSQTRLSDFHSLTPPEKTINTGCRAKIKIWIFTLYMMAGHIFVQHYYWIPKFSPVWYRANRLRTILTIMVIAAIDFLEWWEQQRKTRNL